MLLAGASGHRAASDPSGRPAYKSRELASAITASCDVLVSGVYRDDPAHGSIIRIHNNAAPGQPGREAFDLAGAGAIRFTEPIDDRIAVVEYDGGREGFFDLAENKIVWEDGYAQP